MPVKVALIGSPFQNSEAVRVLESSVCEYTNSPVAYQELPSSLHGLEEHCAVIFDDGDGSRIVAFLRQASAELPLTAIVCCNSPAPSIAFQLGQLGVVDLLPLVPSQAALRSALDRGLTIESMRQSKRGQATMIAERFALLNAKELACFEWLIAGLCNKQIAKRIRRSCRTVESRRQSIFRKMKVLNLTELMTVVARFPTVFANHMPNNTLTSQPHPHGSRSNRWYPLNSVTCPPRATTG